MLFHKKASKAPAIAPLIAERSYIPRLKAMTAKAPKANSETPPRSPSSPSVSFAEKALAKTMNMKSGTYHQPML